METIIGFVAGFLVGTREGREGVERLRSTVQSILASPELHRLAGEGVTLAQATVKQASGGAIGRAVGGVTDLIARRAAETSTRSAA